MPSYPYRCTNCGNEFEMQRSMLQFASPARCLQCGSWDTKRLYQGININFGGSSRAAEGAKSSDKPEENSSTELHESANRSAAIRVENSRGIRMDSVTIDGGRDGIQSINSEISASNMRFRRLNVNAVYSRRSRIKMRDSEIE